MSTDSAVGSSTPQLSSIISNSRDFLSSLSFPIQFSFSDSTRTSRSKRSRSRSSGLAGRDRKNFQFFLSRVESTGEIFLQRALPVWIDEIQAEITKLPTFHRDSRINNLAVAQLPPLLHSDSSDDSSESGGSSEDSDGRPNFSTNFPSHPIINNIVAKFKPRILSFLTCMQSLKLDIQLRNPEISEGGSLIFESQQEILKDLDAGEQLAWRCLDRIALHQAQRAKLASKCVKWPGVADYFESIHSLDERRYVGLQQSMIEIRNAMIAIKDKMEKNEQQIKGQENEYLSNMI